MRRLLMGCVFEDSTHPTSSYSTFFREFPGKCDNRGRVGLNVLTMTDTPSLNTFEVSDHVRLRSPHRRQP